MANIIEINDISAPELEVFTKLTEKQLRHKLEPEKGIFIAESGKVIELALAAGCEPISLLMERRHITGQAQNILARYEDVTVYTGDRDVLAGLTGYKLTRAVSCVLCVGPGCLQYSRYVFKPGGWRYWIISRMQPT